MINRLVRVTEKNGDWAEHGKLFTVITDVFRSLCYVGYLSKDACLNWIMCKNMKKNSHDKAMRNAITINVIDNKCLRIALWQKPNIKTNSELNIYLLIY